MKHARKYLCLLAALVLAAGMFTGCAKTDSDEAFDYSGALNEDGFFKKVTASDYVTLPQYKGIEVSADVLVASDEDVQTQIDSVLSNYTTYTKITDRAAVDGDTLNIDYVGSVAGVEFDGGSTDGAGTDVTIGTTSYIDDFMEQLIGHTPGETFDVAVTFPDDYTDTTLAGKDAVFNVTINSIQGDAIEAELTDAIAVDYGFDTVAELKVAIEKSIILDQKDEFMTTLVEQATVSKIPDRVMDYSTDLALAYYQGYADQYGVDLETFLKTYVGYDTVDAFIADNTESIEGNAKRYLVIQAIAEAEDLTVDDAAIEAAGNTSYVEQYGLGYVKLMMFNTNIVPDFVLANAKMV